MSKNTRLVVAFTLAITMMLVLLGCGGTGSAPINGGSLARVAVSVAPPTMTVTTGTTQPFTATVVNTSETGVGWLVNGFPGGINPANGTTPFGTIDKNGNYTAPPFIPAPPTVTVTAVANADNSATANASVSINGTPSPVSISPLTASLEVGGIALFTARVNGSNLGVTWLVENVLDGNDVVGTVSPVPDSPNQVIYIAPLVVPGGGQSAQVHVTAQSVANPEVGASATVTLSAPVAGSPVVTITNPSVPPTVPVGQTQSFEARVTGTSDTTVSWQVDAITGGNAHVGTIETEAKGAALYQAPEEPAQVYVTAVSNAQPAAQASILVNVIPAQKVTVTLAPDVCINIEAVPVGTTVNFGVSVSGPMDQSVTWQVNKITGGNTTVGTIAQVGTTQGAIYTAPASLPNPVTVVIGAVSVANPSAVATQPLAISLTPNPKVLISPTSANAYASGAGVDFTATVEGLGDNAVADNWEVNGEFNGDDTIGTVAPTSNEPPVGCQSFGSYDPPASVPNPNQVTVAAVTADGSGPLHGAVVTILPPVPVVSLGPGPDSPQGVQVQPPDNIVKYQAQDSDASDTINWTLTSKGQDCSVNNGSICGTVTPTGGSDGVFTATYTAPTAVPPNPQVTVTANSVVAPNAPQTDNYNEITISSVAPTITINGPTTVQAGTGPYSYNVIITGVDPNTPVVWQLGCISDWDGVSPDGNCEPTKEDDLKDGPGCIMYGRAKVCGAGGDLTVPGENALSYSPPLSVSTNDYEQNACTLNGDPKASIVPINAQMQATGCPGGVCTAIACVTVTPP